MHKTIWGKLCGPYGVCLGVSLAHVVIEFLSLCLYSSAVISDMVVLFCFWGRQVLRFVLGVRTLV